MIKFTFYIYIELFVLFVNLHTSKRGTLSKCFVLMTYSSYVRFAVRIEIGLFRQLHIWYTRRYQLCLEYEFKNSLTLTNSIGDFGSL